MTKIVWYGRTPGGADIEIHYELPSDGNDAQTATVFDQQLTAKGFKPSERFAPPRYGGGQRMSEFTSSATEG